MNKKCYIWHLYLIFAYHYHVKLKKFMQFVVLGKWSHIELSKWLTKIALINEINNSAYFSTFAGNGTNELKEGVGISAGIGSPCGITIDQKTGNLYVSSWKAICMITMQGTELNQNFPTKEISTHKKNYWYQLYLILFYNFPFLCMYVN